MKKILFLIFFCAMFMVSKSQFSSASLVAGGLTCSMCSKAVYKALIGVSSIESVKPDISASSYEIVFKKNAAIDLDAIKNSVEAAGFSVAKLRVTAFVNNLLVSNDAHVVLGGNNFHFLNVPKETLNGNITFTLVDKKFTSEKVYKKFARYTTMKCYATGTMESCCKNEASGKRVYHVTI